MRSDPIRSKFRFGKKKNVTVVYLLRRELCKAPQETFFFVWNAFPISSKKDHLFLVFVAHSLIPDGSTRGRNTMERKRPLEEEKNGNTARFSYLCIIMVFTDPASKYDKGLNKIRPLPIANKKVLQKCYFGPSLSFYTP